MLHENPIARRSYKRKASPSSPYYNVTLKLYLCNGFRLIIGFESSPSGTPFKIEVAKINAIKENKRLHTRYTTLVTYHDATYDFVKDKIWEYVNYNRKKKYVRNDNATNYLFSEWANPRSPHNPWKWLKMT